MTEARQVLGFCDILGFSELVIKDVDAARRLLSDFYNHAQQLKTQADAEELELFLFSDCLFVHGDAVESVVKYMCRLYRQSLMYSGTSEYPMLLRGGIASGGILTQRRREAPLVTKHFIVSPALVHANKMQRLVSGQRLLLGANDREDLQHFWNHNIDAICYAQPSITLGKLFAGYKYQDILWAYDLSKNGVTAKRETKALIEVATTLFRANYREKAEVAAHYADTCRICLLAVTSLIESCEEDRSFLVDLVEDTIIPFPHASVWLGFLEMILTSNDGPMFHAEPAIARFLRIAVMDPIWGKVIAEVGKEEHAQLKMRVGELMDTAITAIAKS